MTDKEAVLALEPRALATRFEDDTWIVRGSPFGVDRCVAAGRSRRACLRRICILGAPIDSISRSSDCPVPIPDRSRPLVGPTAEFLARG